eukprot:TRINITY_DN2745_c0_g1_i7.p1 TRINITY_DN2745_c0_g1~~TRINITY_DN2745_c0_g1_i7.p1  ORF type:complete len:183 (-),score=28.64 TRINITY_DN2745_c0_g1_i7:415-963(-)
METPKELTEEYKTPAEIEEGKEHSKQEKEISSTAFNPTEEVKYSMLFFAIIFETKSISDTKIRPARQRFLDGIASGIPIIIDCSFQTVQTDKELNSLCRQISLCYASNKKAPVPVRLIVGSFNGDIQSKLIRAGIKDWDIECREDDFTTTTDLSSFIFLSPDAEETLEDVQQGYLKSIIATR